MGRGLPLRRCSLRVPQLLNADPAPRLGLRAGTHIVNRASVDAMEGPTEAHVLEIGGKKAGYCPADTPANGTALFWVPPAQAWRTVVGVMVYTILV